MPSFLSKVFGRKKDDKESPRSQGRVSPSLLEGKFESVSPSATKFPEVPNGKGNGHGKEKEKEKAKEKEKDSFALFKAKSRPASPDALKKRIDIPQLSLNLPGPKEDSSSRALGVVFEGDPDAQILLGDSIMGERRLNPLETLILVHACTQAITARGLETLGIMHPHWYSASPEIQRRLISLFIQSLAPKSPITTLSPTPSASVSAFESEISSTRSPHDVAAVLRWGLRHLKLEGSAFGKEEGWYNNFFEAERTSGYPSNAFSTHLSPQLPAAHLELLTATLEILSSLAAHAEANGISGSKLSKFFGLWLLTSQRAEEKDDWTTFYARWERTGRILEHLFLSRIRDEAAGSRMPTRLLELVRHYPYNKNESPSIDTNILPRPRFSTRQYDALFVQIETELSPTGGQPKHHPLRLVAEAFNAIAAESGSNTDLWETIKKAGSDQNNDSPGGYPGLSHIFADETIRFLSLIPIDDGGSEPTSPTFSLFLPQKATGASRRRSFSMSDRDKAVAAAAAAASNASPTTRHTKPATEPSTLPTSKSPTDWAEFSTSGFFEDISASKPLASTLLEKEKDMEVTLPRPNKRSKASPISPTNTRKSLDTPRSAVILATPIEEKTISKTNFVSITQLDEAFIDFWSDALLDPISSSWPAFIICKLKSTLTGVEVDGKKLEWLVIEQSFKRPPPPPTSQDSHTSEMGTRRPRPSSPKPSFKSDMTFALNAQEVQLLHLTYVNLIHREIHKGRKKAGNSPRVGEMGEILAEEEEKAVETVKIRVPSPKPRKSVDVPKKSADVSRKSVDVAKKNSENGKANGVDVSSLAAGAAAAVGAVAVVGAIAATATSSPEAVRSDAAPAINGSAAAVDAPPPADSTPVPEVVTPKPEAALPVETKVPAPAPQVPSKVDDEPINTPTQEPLVQNAESPKEVDVAVDTAVAEPIPDSLPQAEIPVAIPTSEELVVAREPTPELEVHVAAAAPVVTPEAPVVVEESEPELPAPTELEPAPIVEEVTTAPPVANIEPTIEAEAVEEETSTEVQARGEVEAPVEAEASVETEAPAQVEAPVEVEAPVQAGAPVNVEIPAEVEVSATVEAPAEADVPAEAEVLVEVEEALDQEVPAAEESPSVPESVEAPVPVEAPAHVEPLTTSVLAAAEPEPVEVKIPEAAVEPTPAPEEVAPVVEDTPAAPEPSVADEPVAAAEPVAHTEPIHAPEHDADDHDVALPAVLVVEAEPAPAAEEPVTVEEPAVIAIEEPAVVAPASPAIPPTAEPIVEDAQDSPPAPESVVASDDTPGPQVALNASELVALALKKADEPIETQATEEEPLKSVLESNTLTQYTPAATAETSTTEDTPSTIQPSLETTVNPEQTISADHNDSHPIPDRSVTPPATN